MSIGVQSIHIVHCVLIVHGVYVYCAWCAISHCCAEAMENSSFVG